MRRGRRRVLGAAVVLGLIAALIAARQLNPGITGNPGSVALPGPPPSGSCLIVDGGPATIVVPCDRPHDAEVTRSWAADAGPSTAPGVRQLAAMPTAEGSPVCDEASADYLPAPAPGPLWVDVPITVATLLIVAPSGERLADRGWLACVLGFPGGRASEPAAALLMQPTDDRCLTQDGVAVTTSCASAHTIELLGVLNPAGVNNGRIPDYPLDRDRLTAACLERVSSLTGAADPTYGGLLRVGTAITPGAGGTYQVGITDPNGQPNFTFLPLPYCSIQLDGGGALTGTVIGLGDRALPRS